jgi:hypothetical protein
MLFLCIMQAEQDIDVLETPADEGSSMERRRARSLRWLAKALQQPR